MAERGAGASEALLVCESINYKVYWSQQHSVTTFQHALANWHASTQ